MLCDDSKIKEEERLRTLYTGYTYRLCRTYLLIRGLVLGTKEVKPVQLDVTRQPNGFEQIEQTCP